jgi:hypothetical protein
MSGLDSALAAIRSGIDAIIGPEALPAANTQGLQQAIGALRQLADQSSAPTTK